MLFAALVGPAPLLAMPTSGQFGSTLHSGENVREAERAIRKGLQGTPTDAGSWLKLAEAYESLEQHEKAIPPMKKFVELRPADAEGWNNLAALFGETDQWALMEDACRHALQCDSSLITARGNLAAAEINLGRCDESIKILTDLLGEHSDYLPAWNSLFLAYVAQGDSVQARKAIDRALEIDPNYVFGLINRGIMRLTIGDQAGALADARRATELAPNSVKAWNKLCACYFAVRDREAGIQAFEKCFALHPADFGSLMELAANGLDLGQWARTEEIMLTLLKMQPDSPRVLAYQSLVLLRLKKVDEAERVALRGVKDWQTDLLALRTMGEILCAQKRFEEGIGYFTKVILGNPKDGTALGLRGNAYLELKDRANAEIDFEHGTEMDPLNPLGWIGLASLREQQGNLSGAIEAAQECLKENPSLQIAQDLVLRLQRKQMSTVDPNLTPAADGLPRGMQLLDQGRSAEAESYLRELTRKEPDNAAVWDMLGTALMQLKRPADAEPCFKQATDLDYSYALAMLDLGRSRRVQSKFLEAIPVLERYVKLKPQNRAGWELLLECLTLRQNYQDIVTYGAEAVQHFPDNSKMRCLIAEAQLNLQSYPEARASAQKAVDLDPANPAGYGMLGQVQAATGDREGARASFAKSTVVAPKSSPAWNSLGYFHLENGEMPEAIECLEKSVSLDPASTISLVNLIRARARHGDIAEAYRTCDQLEKVSPEGAAKLRAELPARSP